MKQSSAITWESEFIPDVSIVNFIREQADDPYLYRRLYSITTGNYSIEKTDDGICIFLNNIRFEFFIKNPSIHVLVLALQNVHDIVEDLDDAKMIAETMPPSESLEEFLKTCADLTIYLQNVYANISQLILQNSNITAEQLQKMVESSDDEDGTK